MTGAAERQARGDRDDSEREGPHVGELADPGAPPRVALITCLTLLV